MTRVLMFCSQFHPIVGGAERQAERLAAKLRGQGVDVAVITPQILPDTPLEDEVRGVPVFRFPLTDLSTVLPVRVPGIGVPNILLRRLQIRHAVRARLADFDLLHIHLASSEACFAMEAAQSMGRPSICKIACGGPGFDFGKMPATSIFAPRLIRRLIEHMTRWIAISEEIKEDLLVAGIAASRIESIPNGIDPGPMSPPSPCTPATDFLYLGRQRKCDITTLIDGFALHHQGSPGSRLRISGAGNYRQALDAIARSDGLAECVEVTGPVDASKAFEWADALIHPTLAEGISNTLLEAMSIGTPCIASNIPPNRELLDGGHAGLLFEPHNPADLSKQMDALSKHPALGTRIARNARERVEHRYDMNIVASRYARFYQELLSESAGARSR